MGWVQSARGEGRRGAAWPAAAALTPAATNARHTCPFGTEIDRTVDASDILAFVSSEQGPPRPSECSSTCRSACRVAGEVLFRRTDKREKEERESEIPETVQYSRGARQCAAELAAHC